MTWEPQIEKGIQLPLKGTTRNGKMVPLLAAMNKMNVWESVFVPSIELERQSVNSCMTRQAELSPSKTFSVRACEGGCRVWRVE